MFERFRYIINVVIVAMLLGAIAIGRDSKIVGIEIGAAKQEQREADPEFEKVLEDGTRVINSTALGREVIGFGGIVPVELYVRDGKVVEVKPLDNSETPSFFKRVLRAGLLERWNGMELGNVATLEVDGVSGATYSADALIQNVQLAAAYGSNSVGGASRSIFDIKTIVGLLVVLLGVVLTFLKPKNKIVIIVQMALNVGVLGFWCGSFLSLSQFVAWMANGVNLSMALVAVALLAVVVILPLLGKRGTYCQMHCPMGSAQDLLDRVPTPKLKLGAKTNKVLNKVRYYILFALLLLMWVGVGFSLMDYEVFSAFLLSSASAVVLVMGSVFLLLSLFIRKPYCRIVCPTGALITIMQSSGKANK